MQQLHNHLISIEEPRYEKTFPPPSRMLELNIGPSLEPPSEFYERKNGTVEIFMR